MIIDCHAHLVPQSWFHPKSPKWMFDLPHLFDEQDKSGVDITVFGNNWIRSPDGYDPLKVVHEFNVHAAELTAKPPKRLLGLACSVPNTLRPAYSPGMIPSAGPRGSPIATTFISIAAVPPSVVEHVDDE